MAEAKDKKVDVQAAREKALQDVFKSIAEILNFNSLNVSHIKFAKELMESRKKEDYQRRF